MEHNILHYYEIYATEKRTMRNVILVLWVCFCVFIYYVVLLHYGFRCSLGQAWGS